MVFVQRIHDIQTFFKNQRFFQLNRRCVPLMFIRQFFCVVCCGFKHIDQKGSFSKKQKHFGAGNSSKPVISTNQFSKHPGCHVDAKNLKTRRNNFRRTIIIGLSTLTLTTLLLTSTSVTQLIVFRSDFLDERDLQSKLNRSLAVVKKCQLMTSFVHENLLSFPFALIALFIFSCFIKRDKYCRRCFNGRPGLPTPMEPFKMKNRFSTAIIFGLLACEVLKIFEELLFKTSTRQPLGILLDLSIRVGFVFLIGMRYYPLLVSLQLRKNPVCTGVACVYAWFDMIYVVIKQGFCMGFVPISTLSGLVDEARLRLELGSWYVVYGLIRNAPHFACLSYVTSEFTTRFIEALRSKTGITSSYHDTDTTRRSQFKLYEQDVLGYCSRESLLKIMPTDSARTRMPISYESCWDDIKCEKLIIHRTDQNNFFSLAFTDSAPNHIYVRNLLKKNKPKTAFDRDLTQRYSTIRKLFASIYVWRDDFRFSTIAVCTFVTAFVFLYYLACTLAFYHLSRTEGHGFVLNFYFKHILNINPNPLNKYSDDIVNALTFWREICIAGILAYCVFAVQMFHSMKQYRANKLMMYKGIFEDIPSARHLEPSKMIAQSVHYSGFLIGYMAWGFIIVFYIMLMILCTISILFRQRIEYIATAIAFLVPVFMIYAMKILLVRSTSKAVFTQGFGSKMALNNRRIHAVFVYFNFFFDCFLGIIACLTRLFKSVMLNVVFMARLDYSFVGRPLERLDPGFSTYVAFLHTEVAHTHPVMVAFCDMIWRRIVLRRMGLISRDNGSGRKKGLPIIRDNRCERARFRWMLSYTLIKNGGLLSFRKNLTSRLQFIVMQRYACKNSIILEKFPVRFDDNQHAGDNFSDNIKFGGCKEQDFMLPPSIRVYSTTGVGDLLASAGERIHDCNESNHNEVSFSDDDETVALLKPNDPDTIPLVLEAVYPSSFGQGASEFLHYIDSTHSISHDIFVQPDDSSTVLRIASYSERDALWRQGVRERVCSRSRYRYHYGCLNQLPAVKVLDLAHYRHISSQQQCQIINGRHQRKDQDISSHVTFFSRPLDTSDSTSNFRTDEGCLSISNINEILSKTSDHNISISTGDPSYATAQSINTTIVASNTSFLADDDTSIYHETHTAPPRPPRSNDHIIMPSHDNPTVKYNRNVGNLLDPYSLLAKLSSDFTVRSHHGSPIVSRSLTLSPLGSLAQAFQNGRLENIDDPVDYNTNHSNDICKYSTNVSDKLTKEYAPTPPLPPPPTGSSCSTPALRSNPQNSQLRDQDIWSLPSSNEYRSTSSTLFNKVYLTNKFNTEGSLPEDKELKKSKRLHDARFSRTVVQNNEDMPTLYEKSPDWSNNPDFNGKSDSSHATHHYTSNV